MPGQLFQSSQVGVPTFEVAVIGGGIGGLTTLNALRARGYNAVLVTAGKLGDGQTLKCHGFISRGFYLSGLAPAMAKVFKQNAEKFDAAGLNYNGSCMEYSMPNGMAEKFLAGAVEAGIPHEVVPDERATASGRTVFRVQDEVFSKPGWTRQLARGNGEHIRVNTFVSSLVQCDVDGASGWELALKPSQAGKNKGQEESTIRAKYVVVAAGTGNKTVLNAVHPPVPDEYVTCSHQVRPVYMFCVKGPKALLGADSRLAFRPEKDNLMIVANLDEQDADSTVLYCTPNPGNPKPDAPAHVQPTREEWNHNAEWKQHQEFSPDFAKTFFDTFFLERPELYQHRDQLEFGIYGGEKQDAGWEQKPMQFYAGDLSGRNLSVANTQMITGAFAMAENIVEQVEGKFSPESSWNKQACQHLDSVLFSDCMGSIQIFSDSNALPGRVGNEQLDNAVGCVQEAKDGAVNFVSFDTFCQERGVNQAELQITQP